MASVREYAILYVRGTRTAGVVVGGGNAVLATGQHALDGPEHTATSDTTDLDASPTAHGLLPKLSGKQWETLHGDGAFAAFETPFDHGNMGAAGTIDLANGTWHRSTLDADCTITVTGFGVDEGVVALAEIAQDGTGGRAITWDADVTFIGDDQPDATAGTVTIFLLFSSAGDTTIYGVRVGAPTVAALDDLSDVTLTAPVIADRLRYDGAVWANSNLVWEPLFDNTGTAILDAHGDPVMQEVAI